MSTVRAAGAISAMTLASRVLGMVRDALMTAVLGAGWVPGTFLLAWMLPNLLRRLFGEGALSAAFIPVYSKTLKKDGPEPARRLLAQVSGTLLGFLLVVALVVVVASALVPGDLLPVGADADGELFLSLNMILFPYTVPICMVALYAGALNSRGVFALPAAAPIVLNGFWIGGILLVLALGMDELPTIALLVAASLLLGGVAQLLLVTIPLYRRRMLPAPVLAMPERGSQARAVFVAMGPTVIGLSLVQVNTLMDQAMAYFLIAPGANIYVYLANRLLLFPHALTTLAVAVAVFPKLSVLAGDQDRAGLRRSLDGSVIGTLFVTLPAAVGMILIAPDLIRILFEHGLFTPEDTVETSRTTAFLVAGLPLIGIAQLHARAFYALDRPATPARVAGWLVVINLVLNLLFITVFDMRTAGLALATSITALANACILRRLLARACPEGALPLSGVWVRSGVATAAMGLSVWGVRSLVGGDGILQEVLLQLLLPVAAGMAVYALAHLLLRSPELRTLRRRRG